LSTTVLGDLLLAVLCLLVILAEGAGATAAGEGEVRDKVALEAVFVAELNTLHHERDNGETDIAEGGDEDALFSLVHMSGLKCTNRANLQRC
jgi:hypothetical protein